MTTKLGRLGLVAVGVFLGVTGLLYGVPWIADVLDPPLPASVEVVPDSLRCSRLFGGERARVVAIVANSGEVGAAGALMQVTFELNGERAARHTIAIGPVPAGGQEAVDVPVDLAGEVWNECTARVHSVR